MRPHRWQPTRLPRPWDSPGRNTGAGCHFLLQCMKVKSESEVAQSCPTLSETIDCSLPGSSVHGIFQARILEWVAISFSMISFRMDWLDLLAVQGTLKSLLQHHSSKASILSRSAFFTVQLSHPYMANGKTLALTRQTFVGKVMSLLFNMLSRLVMEKAMATHSSTLAWKNPMDGGAW